METARALRLAAATWTGRWTGLSRLANWGKSAARPAEAHSPGSGGRSCGREAEGGGLLNRYTVEKPYRGFESLRLRQISEPRLFAAVRPCLRSHGQNKHLDVNWGRICSPCAVATARRVRLDSCQRSRLWRQIGTGPNVGRRAKRYHRGSCLSRRGAGGVVTPAFAPIDWPESHCIIRSIYPPVFLFEGIADPADWELVASAEAKTNRASAMRLATSRSCLSRGTWRVPAPASSWGHLRIAPLIARAASPKAPTASDTLTTAPRLR